MNTKVTSIFTSATVINMIESYHDQMFHLLGKRIELVFTDDEYTKLKPGSMGIVNFIDDFGTVFVSWEDGSSLGLVPGVDRWKVKY